MKDRPVVVVTGANRGIGYEICRQLAGREARVVLTARDPSAGKSAADALSVAFHPLDVTDDASAERLSAYLGETYGCCDVLINNAGMLAKSDRSILAVTPSTVEHTLATNTVAPLRLTQVLLPLLRRSSHRARVINVSSGAGEISDFDGSWAPAYSLSKAALNLVTRSLAHALANEGIVVNAMCPSWVRTDMGGEGAPRDVSQGADTAVWLALDAPPTLSGKFLRDHEEIPW